MSQLTDALDDWRAAARELDATMPWTAPWLRARMVEEERRLSYLAFAGEDEPEPEPDGDTVGDRAPRDYRAIGVS